MEAEVHRPRAAPQVKSDGAGRSRFFERLVRYRRFCERGSDAGRKCADSYEIARHLGVGASLFRKDVSRFGGLGIKGKGYDLEHLGARLATVLGGSPGPNLAIAGVGNLGSALLAHDGFRERGFQFVAAFDTDPLKIGTTRCGVIISHPSHYRRVLQGISVGIGIIAVPAARAQHASDLFASIGAEAILNMAPVRLDATGKDLPQVRDLDLTLELEKLACRLNCQMGPGAHGQGRLSD